MKKYNTKIIIGAQWGDEGKGKISDFLAQKADVVVRYQGGNNAGHSIEFKGNRYALQHIPSGIFNSKTVNIMAQGMVINPKMLLKEIDELKIKGITNFKLYISDRAHVIMPYHIDIDKAIEKLKYNISPNKAIGTTKKGIGPAYEDKISRIGIRFGDFVNPDVFKKLLKENLIIKNEYLNSLELKPYKLESLFAEYKNYAKELKDFVIETGNFLSKELKNGSKVIFEGAQGTMLCIENGTYPYVTSSSPTASYVPLGAGINHSYINEVIGVIKAYTSRVGAGGMPTSLEKTDPSIANLIRNKGKEFGTVTNRPRQVGWLDAVALKHSIRVSGFTSFALTLLDVLDELEEIKIAYSYTLDGKEIDYIPGSYFEYQKCLPKYKIFKGWKQNTSHVKSFEELPREAKLYIKGIEDILKIPINIFSVGPDREQTIEIKNNKKI